MSRASGGIMSRPPRKQALALSPAAGTLVIEASAVFNKG
jgi:hypothetical protein